MNENQNCEILKNSGYTAVIDGYTSEGHGVCRINGRAVFVPRALRGEEWRVRIVKVSRSAVYGRGEELVSPPSKARIEPDCPHFPRCGGCALRHMTYEEELAFKLDRVNDAFARLGGLSLRAEKIIGSQEIISYRNKAIYACAPAADGVQTGYFRARSHELVPVSRCLLVPEQADALAGAVRTWARNFGVPAYDETTGRGLLRHVFVRTASDGAALLCVVATGEIFHARELIELARKAVPGLRGVVLNINKARGNTVLAGDFKTLWGEGFVREHLCGLEYRLSPQSFFQVNTRQAEVLYGLAKDFAEPRGGLLLDLYCGTGTIGLSMADGFEKLVGAEIVPEAIRDAGENAAQNGVTNAEFLCGDALECAHTLASRGERPDVVVVDPPRRGLAPGVALAVATMSPRRVVYVSCDPATLARDLKLFAGLGYEGTRAVAVDMFPRTAHVECVVGLARV